MATITVEDLHKRFGGFVAVRQSTFSVPDGSFFVLLGPSGCGKTTTLRLIAGLELPTSGRILLDGQNVSQQRASQRDIAFVFQLFALYPHMNVRRNIGFPLSCQGMRRGDIRARVEEAARLLRIDHLLDQPVSRLSGGDRQRVALGRAIVRRPKAFLMDEPLGALDTEFRALMCAELRGLHERLHATTVYVTHDQLEAMSMADRIAVMNHGVVEQIDTPLAVYRRPATMFVAGFVGSPPMNLLQAEGGSNGAVRIAGTALPLPPGGERAVAMTLGVRPEDVTFDDTASLRGEIVAMEYLGTTQIATVASAAGPLKVRLPARASARAGERVGLSFRSLSLFDSATGRALMQAAEAAHG